ncbi:hypothetical protein XENTR_v10014552 [Xenopus tropicalis]|nr:hypothetical protein XENTR_v10014552 [Xenopus tropicalis]
MDLDRTIKLLYKAATLLEKTEKRRNWQRDGAPSQAQLNSAGGRHPTDSRKGRVFCLCTINKTVLYFFIVLLIIGLVIMCWVVVDRQHHINELKHQLQLISNNIKEIKEQLRNLQEKELKLNNLISTLQAKLQKSSQKMEDCFG